MRPAPKRVAPCGAPSHLIFNANYLTYRSPLLFDDEFEGRVEIARLGDTSMMVEILLARDGAPVAEGELRYVFVESGGGSIAPIPEPIRAGLARYQPGDAV